MNDKPIYEWRWEDEPDFSLPHADHITIEKVWLDDGGISEDREEMCIIVVRHPYSKDVHSRAYAERRAMAICDSMNAAELIV